MKDKLPRGSHYKTALQLDRDIAEEIAKLPESNEPPTPLEYNLEAYLLLAVIDQLRSLQGAVIASAGADPPSFEPMTRPWTALDSVKDEQHRARIQNLFDKFTAPENVLSDN
ncbi:hypothetical protein [Rhodococcoides fascians]|uniref:hypothetical protein n=1 Tax=Rhodococcoides fascians TaxID=1828 RepID=UPI000AE1BFE0|nr:hypothetical protein [Rhodococcus fascians]